MLLCEVPTSLTMSCTLTSESPSRHRMRSRSGCAIAFSARAAGWISSLASTIETIPWTLLLLLFQGVPPPGSLGGRLLSSYQKQILTASEQRGNYVLSLSYRLGHYEIFRIFCVGTVARDLDAGGCGRLCERAGAPRSAA